MRCLYTGMQLIALREITATGNTLYFVHTDHLGSVSAVTCGNSGGCPGGFVIRAVVGRQYYRPYGGPRGAAVSLPTDRAFTGQYRDATGLDYFRARYFSSSLGRFISADSIVPGAGNPQALNRYAFVLGNPLKYTDPTGHSPCRGHGKCGGGGSSRETSNGSANKVGCLGAACKPSRQDGCLGVACNPSYTSYSAGVDIPSIVMGVGAVVSALGGPEAGVPLALAGAAIEAGAYTGAPPAALIKSTTIGALVTVDSYGQVYAGPQISIGKSAVPIIGLSITSGRILTDDSCHPYVCEQLNPKPIRPATAAESRSFLEGPSLSVSGLPAPLFFGLTGIPNGLTWSPFASNNFAYTSSWVSTAVASLDVSWTWKLPFTIK